MAGEKNQCACGDSHADAHPQCPRCLSPETEKERVAKPAGFFLRTLTALFSTQIWKCERCGHEFTPEESK